MPAKNVMLCAIALMMMLSLSAMIVSNEARAGDAILPVPGLEKMDVNPTQNQSVEQLWQQGEAQGLFGPLNYSNGVAVGKFVRFDFNEADGTITNFTVWSGSAYVPVFDQISSSGLGSSQVTTIGPLFKAVGTSMAVVAHNDPNAILVVASGGSGDQVSFTLSPGMTLTNTTGAVGETFNVTGNGVDGWLQVFSGSVVTTSSGLTTTLDQGSIMFRMVPSVESTGSGNEAIIMSAIADGQLGGQISVTTLNGGIAYESQNLNGLDTVAKVDNGSIAIVVNGSVPAGSGSVLMVSVDHTTLNPTNGVTVSVDGQTAVPATDLSSIIASVNNNATNPSYLVLNGTNTGRYMVYLPNASGSVVVTLAQAPSTGVGGSFQLSLGPAAILGGLVAMSAVAVTLVVMVSHKKR